MEYAINVTLDDDATPNDVALAIEGAALYAAKALRNEGKHLPIDDQASLGPTAGKLQDATLFRHA